VKAWRGRRLRRRWGWDNRRVDRCGVVAQVEEDGGGWLGQSECGAGVAVGDGDGVDEGRIDGDGVDEEEVGAGESAGLSGIGGAVKLGEDGQTDKGCKGEPVAAGWFGCGGS